MTSLLQQPAEKFGNDVICNTCYLLLCTNFWLVFHCHNHSSYVWLWEFRKDSVILIWAIFFSSDWFIILTASSFFYYLVCLLFMLIVVITDLLFNEFLMSMLIVSLLLFFIAAYSWNAVGDESLWTCRNLLQCQFHNIVSIMNL